MTAAQRQLTDLNIAGIEALPPPSELVASLPSEGVSEAVFSGREAIRKVIFGEDKRFLLISGPCSIHDVDAGREYAARLAKLAREVSDKVLVVMRVYFEKPRTTVGWKGLIMDPHLDGSHDIATGLRVARRFLHEVLELGLPTATEFVDPITPQYIGDLVCWAAIGARTAESQTHRQVASGLSMPIGFKNGTDGSVQTAVNGIQAAMQPHTFLSVSMQGRVSAVATRGNPNCHIVLRGGTSGANYSASHIAKAELLLEKAGLPKAILVDCSHDNSSKKPEHQPVVMRDILGQIAGGNRSIIGGMLESNLHAGNQPFPQPKSKLKYGVSITDGCLDWQTTEALVREIQKALPRR